VGVPCHIPSPLYPETIVRSRKHQFVLPPVPSNLLLPAWAPANPAPKFGITVFNRRPSQAPLPFISKLQVPLERHRSCLQRLCLPGQLLQTGIALGNPAPNLESPCQQTTHPRRHCRSYPNTRCHWKRHRSCSSACAASQLPTTGIAFGKPTPKFGITLSTDDPSQAPLPFMSKYQVPLKDTHTFDPGAIPVANHRDGIWQSLRQSSVSPCQQTTHPIVRYIHIKYQEPLENTPIFDSVDGVPGNGYGARPRIKG